LKEYQLEKVNGTFRLITGNGTTFVSLIFGKSLGNFIPFNWIPILIEGDGINKNDAEQIKKRIIWAMNRIDVIFFPEDNEVAKVIAPNLDISEFHVLKYEKNQIWINKKLKRRE
jgi:hypothetical protein